MHARTKFSNSRQVRLQSDWSKPCEVDLWPVYACTKWRSAGMLLQDVLTFVGRTPPPPFLPQSASSMLVGA